MPLRFILLIVALVFGAQPAQAKRVKVTLSLDAPKYQNKRLSPDATQWHCHYNGGVRVLCRLANAGEVAMPVAVSAHLPEAVHWILNHPARVAEGLVSIPLLGVPFDMEMTGKLAEAVMCGAKAACGIIFGETHAELMAHIAAAEPMVLAGR